MILVKFLPKCSIFFCCIDYKINLYSIFLIHFDLYIKKLLLLNFNFVISLLLHFKKLFLIVFFSPHLFSKCIVICTAKIIILSFLSYNFYFWFLFPSALTFRIALCCSAIWNWSCGHLYFSLLVYAHNPSSLRK